MADGPARAEHADTVDTVDAVVVGAGFSGLLAVHRLTGLGLTVRGFEAGGDVGGTWYWNRYPGARTDSQAHIYCYTFDEDLRDEWDWSERYPGQPEVLAYLEHVADRYDLRRHFTFDARVVAAEYDADAAQWVVRTEAGAVVRATYLVSGVGIVSAVNWPALPGLADFAGERIHTARWPQGGVDLAGRRVGLLGVGSTGIQLLPHLAAQAEHVTVLQRTPNYVVPAQNRPLTEADRARARESHEEIHAQIRSHPYSHPYAAEAPSAKEASDAERREVFERGWEDGGFAFLMATYDDLVIDAESNELASEFVREKIREIVQDPATAEVLTPKGYPYAVKRPPAGTDYYETFNRENVEVVDLLTTPVDRVTETGIVVGGREVPLDVLVCATGFDASTGGLKRMGVRGRNGIALTDVWKDGARTHLGLGVPGFPNLFMILGPQQPFANIPTCIEDNVEWIAGAIAHARENGIATIEATDEAADAWGSEVETIGNMTLARHGAAVNSWMAGANVEGKPREFLFYFGGANNYFDRCAQEAAAGYTGFALTPRT